MTIRTNTLIKFILNLIFAIYNCVLGIAMHSWWFVASGAYYIVLCVMRMGVIAFSAKDRKNETFIMKVSGVMIFLLSIVLCGIVYMTVEHDVAVKYHEIAMITIALYAFVKITIAVVKFVKSRKNYRPYIITLRCISFADAVVSIYSLQRSMLVSFPGMGSTDIILFNTLSGIDMCIFVIFIGLYLITRKENKNG